MIPGWPQTRYASWHIMDGMKPERQDPVVGRFKAAVRIGKSTTAPTMGEVTAGLWSSHASAIWARGRPRAPNRQLPGSESERYQNSHRIFRNLLLLKNFRRFCSSRNWRLFSPAI